MKANAKIRITNLKDDEDQIEAELGYKGIRNGLTGKLVSGKQDSPKYNPGYYEVQLKDGRRMLLHRDEFELV